MPRFPYSVRPIKSSENVNKSQKAKSVLLGRPQIAENNIENGLRKRLNSLKENNSNVLGLLSQRLSNVEKELQTIKTQLRDANRLLQEKDDEIRRLKAQINGDVTKSEKNSPEKRKVSKSPNLSSISEENLDRVRGSIEIDDKNSPDKKNCSPDLVVLRPGEVKPEFKKFKNGADIKNASEVDRPPKTGSPSVSESSRVSELEKENRQLAKKVAELEKFIGEYGLMWVGDNALEETISQPESEMHIKTKTTVRIKTPNLDNVITVISDLNQNVSEQHIVKSPLGAKFKRCDILELKLFADGMQLETNPFRKYDTPSAEAFFKDLEDGYFPSELKSKHPQGVIFKVVDKRNLTYREATEVEKPQPFSGQGVRLGGKEDKEVPEPKQESGSPKQRVVPEPKQESGSPKQRVVPLKSSPTKKVADVSDKSGLHEHWVNKTSPLPSRNRVDREGPPQIEVQSVPLEINLAPPNQTPVSDPKKEPSKVFSPPHETGPPQRVFSDQAVYQRAPINITNITYHEAPVTLRLSPEEASTLPPAKSAGCVVPCRCPRARPNEICPGTCGQLGSHKAVCPCGCGAQADLRVHQELPKSDKLSPSRFKGRTEYEENYSKTALLRMRQAGYKEEPEKPEQPAGKPSGFQPVDPNEEYEHFTYIGHPKGQNAPNQRISYRPKIVELNKKTSETMISIRLRSDKNNKTYLVHLYPNEPIEKIWSILNVNGEEFELVGKVGNKPVILLDGMSPAEQNVKDFDVVTYRRSPQSVSPKSKKSFGSATGMWSQGSTSNSPTKSIPSPQSYKSKIGSPTGKLVPTASATDRTKMGSPTSPLAGKLTIDSPTSMKSMPSPKSYKSKIGSPTGKLVPTASATERSKMGSPTSPLAGKLAQTPSPDSPASRKSFPSPKIGSPTSGKLVPVASIEQKSKIGSPTSGKLVPVASATEQSKMGSPTSPLAGKLAQASLADSPTSRKSIPSPKIGSPNGKLMPVPSSTEQKPKISSSSSPGKTGSPTSPTKSLKTTDLPPLKVPSSDMTLPNFTAKSPLREKVQEIIEDKYEEFLKKKSKTPHLGEDTDDVIVKRTLSGKSVAFPTENPSSPKPAEINPSIKSRSSHAENKLSAQIASKRDSLSEEKSPRKSSFFNNPIEVTA